jgi:hypothetical protein
MVENGSCFSSKVGREPAFGMRDEFGSARPSSRSAEVLERFAKGFPYGLPLTAIADPRRGSGYRRDGFGSARDAPPLSGTADARILTRPGGG